MARERQNPGRGEIMIPVHATLTRLQRCENTRKVSGDAEVLLGKGDNRTMPHLFGFARYNVHT